MGGADMKRSGAVREINGETARGKKIPADQEIVWRIKGGETHDLSLDISAWQSDPSAEQGSGNGGKRWLMNFSPPDWLEVEFPRPSPAKETLQ
jgi:hypothetical protein